MNTRERPQASCHPDRPHKAHGLCNSCYRVQQNREWRHRNPERVRELARKRRLEHPEYHRREELKRYQRNRAFVNSTKEGKPCMDCGVLYPPYVMEYDHRDPATKTNALANMVSNASLGRLAAEIAKCDLVCANCHRMRTHGATYPATP